MTKTSIHKKHASHSPGGRKCGCCFPQSGKFRKRAKRWDAKQERQFLNGLIEEDK